MAIHRGLCVDACAAWRTMKTKDIHSNKMGVYYDPIKDQILMEINMREFWNGEVIYWLCEGYMSYLVVLEEW